MNELLFPSVVDKPANKPMNELLFPDVFDTPAARPKNELFKPAMLLNPASRPTKVLLLPDVFELPAPTPANKLFVPGLLRMRLPPILYSVLVLMLPVTSSFAAGLLVPMPTLPPLENCHFHRTCGT